MTAEEARKALRAVANPDKVPILQGFFKTGKGEYGEGDRFLGVVVPDNRKVAKQFKKLSLKETQKLLDSAIHEERLLALLILIDQYKVGVEVERESIFRFYLENTSQINSWDLVDLSAPEIVGGFLKTRERKILDRLAKSRSLWERRIAIVATLHFIRNHDFADTLRLSQLLLKDAEDLIHKACGWMLREVGKREEEALEGFLNQHHKAMPRTMLRYAIERLAPAKRLHYLNK